MCLLLAARGRRGVRRDRSRQDDLYGAGQLLGSLMRHLRGLASIEVPLVSRGVHGPAGLGALIAAACRAERLAARHLGAHPRAVPVPVVAPATQEEHLAAPGTCHKP